MSIMKFFLFSFVLFVSFFAFAQSSKPISFTLQDRLEKTAIPNAKVKITFTTFSSEPIDSILSLVSDFDGQVFFTLPLIEGRVTFDFSCSHPVFDSYEKHYDIKPKSDTLKFTVLLSVSKEQVFKESVIKAPGIPDTFFSSTRVSVSDYEILNDGSYMLLAYEKRLEKQSELLLFDGQQITATYVIPDEAQYLIKDYRNNAHVVCSTSVFGTRYSNGVLEIGQIPRDYFFKYIAPIVDSNVNKLYFSNFNKDYPAFDYFTYDLIDSTYKSIMHIEDDFTMELYRAEYKWVDVRTQLWAKNKEIETGIDAEIWVGANYFTQSIFYKEVYAPLFQRHDSVLVFDFPKDQIRIFNNVGDSLSTVPIFFHYQKRQTGWQRNLIQDRATGEVYALFEMDGNQYLGLISIANGQIARKYKLFFKYVDEVKIDNGWVSYIYRPFESTQKKFLYREKLPN